MVNKSDTHYMIEVAKVTSIIIVILSMRDVLFAKHAADLKFKCCYPIFDDRHVAHSCLGCLTGDTCFTFPTIVIKTTCLLATAQKCVCVWRVNPVAEQISLPHVSLDGSILKLVVNASQTNRRHKTKFQFGLLICLLCQIQKNQ